MMFIVKLLINIAFVIAGLFGAWKISQHTIKLISLGTMVMGLAKVMAYVVCVGLAQYVAYVILW